MKIVDMIASGYDWNCPHCETWNKEIAIPKADHETLNLYVTCDNCKKVSEVFPSEIEHAYE